MAIKALTGTPDSIEANERQQQIERREKQNQFQNAPSIQKNDAKGSLPCVDQKIRFHTRPHK